MAKFSAMAVTTDIKQGLERGPQGVIQSATFDIPKQMATTFVIEKALGLKYLSGTGLVNPALTVNLGNVVSGLKEGVRRLIEGTATQNLSSIGNVSGRTDVPVASEKPPAGTFNAKGFQGDTLYRAAGTPASTKEISSKGEAFTQQTFALRAGAGYSTLGIGSSDTPANDSLPKDAPAQSKVQPVVNARRNPIDSVAVSSDQKFSALRPDSPTIVASRDLETPAITIYPQKLKDIKLTTSTHPFISGPLSSKPTPAGKKTFEFIRSANSYNLVTLKPPSTSAVDKDTPAGQPRSGKEAELDEVKRAQGKRTGSSIQKDSVQTGGSFTVGPKINQAMAASPSKMSSVKKHILQGNTFQGFEEFAQSHRFYVADFTLDGNSVFEWEENGSPPTTLAAGFSGCTSPRFEIAQKEIKEGTWEFPRVFCTGATAQSVTLSKGLVKTETGFYMWILNAMRGLLTRRTIKIASYGRNPRIQNAWTRPENLDDVTSCVWTLYNCYPVGYRASQDWDGDSGKMQISELDMHYEWFEESEGTLYRGVTAKTA